VASLEKTITVEEGRPIYTAVCSQISAPCYGMSVRSKFSQNRNKSIEKNNVIMVTLFQTKGGLNMERRFQVFPVDNSPGFIISHLAREVNACLYRAFMKNGFNITAQQWGVLSKIKECEGLHQSEIAELTVKNRHNISRILRHLEQSGLINKEHDPVDKRLHRIYATTKGREMHSKLAVIAEQTAVKLFSGVSDGDMDTLKRIYRRVLVNAGGDMHTNNQGGYSDG